MLAKRSSPTFDPDAILASIRKVRDPCSESLGYPLDLVEMGLVEAIDTHERQIQVMLCLTEPSCMFGMQIATLVEQQLLEDLGPEVEVSVRLVAPRVGEVWTEDRMEPEAREALRAHRAALAAERLSPAQHMKKSEVDRE